MISKLIGSVFIVGMSASTTLVHADVSDKLVEAAGRGNADRVEMLLSDGVDPNSTDSGGRIVLITAALYGHSEIVEHLLKAGADVNATAKDGATALMMASFLGRAEVVEVLLKAGANVNATAQNGATPLTMASSKGHVEVIRLLLKAGATLNAATTGGSMTALVAASYSAQVKSIEVLLDAGADVNAAMTDGATALIAVSHSGHAKTAEVLLDAGADVNATDTDGGTALMVASQNGHTDVVEVLLDAGADVNATMTNGVTALGVASKGDHTEVVEVLLDAGADVNATATHGVTALMVASKNGHTEVVEVLLKAGADAKVARADGETALRLAQNNQHDEIAKILLNSVADLDAASSSVQQGSINQSKYIQPIVPSLAQMANIPSFRLGQGYQTVASNISQLEMAIEYPNVILVLNVDGQMVKITKENGSGILMAFKERLEVYREAIEQRGHVEIEGWYTVQINESLEGEDYFDLVELFADEELSRRRYLLAREIQIKQEGINVELAHTMVIRGEKWDLSMPGLAIGESMVFEVPNIDIRFYGTLRDDTIEIKVDLNEVERTLSFQHAMDSLNDPAKAAASELHKEKPSEWIVRLKRKPSDEPAELSPSDQLFVLTPDKKLVKVTRAEVELD